MTNLDSILKGRDITLPTKAAETSYPKSRSGAVAETSYPTSV